MRLNPVSKLVRLRIDIRNLTEVQNPEPEPEPEPPEVYEFFSVGSTQIYSALDILSIGSNIEYPYELFGLEVLSSSVTNTPIIFISKDIAYPAYTFYLISGIAQ
jgi:hypothetical protein